MGYPRFLPDADKIRAMIRIDGKLQEFLDSNDSKLHDLFFGSCANDWVPLINQGDYWKAENFWYSALCFIQDFESKNHRIHKGTLFYFWAITCILNGDLEKGFLLMHCALEEDRLTDNLSGKQYPDSPAYHFVTLNYDNVGEFSKPKLYEIAGFLDNKLNDYRNSRRMLLTLDDFRSRFLIFLSNGDKVDMVFYFIYSLFRAKKLQGLERALMANNFSSLVLRDLIFSICLVKKIHSKRNCQIQMESFLRLLLMNYHKETHS